MLSPVHRHLIVAIAALTAWTISGCGHDLALEERLYPCDPEITTTEQCPGGGKCVFSQDHGVTVCEPAPAFEGEIRPIEVVAGEKHGCALTTARQVHCWGGSLIGDRPQPIEDEYTSLAANDSTTCGVTGEGHIRCWNGDDELRDRSDYVATSVSGRRVCGLTEGGEAVCTGMPWTYGAPSGTFSKFSAGDLFWCGIDRSGIAVCGRAAGDFDAAPPEGTKVHDISSGRGYVCAILADSRELRCWGELPNGAVPPSGTFDQVAAGDYVACAIDTTGVPRCWGRDRALPGENVQLEDGEFIDIDCGTEHCCGIEKSDRVYCWGNSSDDRTAVPSDFD